MAKIVLKLLCLASGLILGAAALGADPAPLEQPLFASRDTLFVQIEGPVASLIRERSNTEYYDGKLSYREADGSRQELDLKFRTRGNFRRRKDTCRFPPVRLNFKRKQARGTVFEGQNILKLVTHCRTQSGLYEQFVLKEYLAYRILELHTPYSFRTRLLKITWIDTEGTEKPDERFGFVIEHKNDLARRNGLSTVDDLQKTSHSKLDVDQASIAAIFQYFIGNTDFSLIAGPPDDGCCHNSILLTADGQTFLPVPYDFDFSGFVDAPYAEPNPRFRIKRVTNRLYRGDCAYSSGVDAAVALYLERKDAVVELINDQEGLAKGSRKRTIGFIGRFYKEIANPAKVEARFVKGCS